MRPQVVGWTGYGFLQPVENEGEAMEDEDMPEEKDQSVKKPEEKK